MSVLRVDGTERQRYVNINAQANESNPGGVGRNLLASIRSVGYAVLNSASKTDNLHVGWHIAEDDAATTGDNDTLLGSNLFYNGYGDRVVGIGSNILHDPLAPVPTDSLFIGHRISNDATDTGSINDSIFIGSDINHGTQSCDALVAIGNAASDNTNNVDMDKSVALGHLSLYQPTTAAARMVAVGETSFYLADNCSDGVAVGHKAGRDSIGNANTFTGRSAGQDLVGIAATCTGYLAGNSAIGNNLGAYGHYAGNGALGDANNFYGYDCGRDIAFTHDNIVAMGTSCLKATTAGGNTDFTNCTVIGNNAMRDNVKSTNATVLGQYAFAGSLATSTGVCALGQNALRYSNGVTGTTAVGAGAGLSSSSTFSTFLGGNAGASGTANRLVCFGYNCAAPATQGRLAFGDSMEGTQAGAPTFGTARYLNVEWNGVLIQIPCFIAP